MLPAVAKYLTRPCKMLPAFFSPYIGGEADSDTIAKYINYTVQIYSATPSPM